ncbi:MAG: hypothetical protein LBJ01_02455 [Tannerella sp.]|jgi:hypothetical protein|nr:hypothetical protein [Tannerella sp.]
MPDGKELPFPAWFHMHFARLFSPDRPLPFHKILFIFVPNLKRNNFKFTLSKTGMCVNIFRFAFFPDLNLGYARNDAALSIRSSCTVFVRQGEKAPIFLGR